MCGEILESQIDGCNQTTSLVRREHQQRIFSLSTSSRGWRNVNRVANGDPGGSRTPNPQIRSLMLYPIELRGHLFMKKRFTRNTVFQFMSPLYAVLGRTRDVPKL